MFNNKAQQLRDFNYILGQAQKGRGFCFYFEKAKETTPDHEYNHVLYAELDEHKTVYAGEFLHEIKKLIKLPEVISEVFEVNKNEILTQEIESYHLKLGGEIFADLTRIFDHHSIAGFYVHYMNTAGALDEYVTSLGESHPYYNVIRKSIQVLEQKVDALVEQFEELVFYANHLHVADEAKAMLVVFGADPRKTLRHMKYKYASQIDSLPPYEEDTVENKFNRYR
jgi:hypothetical protein